MGSSGNLSDNSKQESLIRKFRIKFWILDVFAIIISYVIAFFIRNNIGEGLNYSQDYLYLLLLMIPTFFVLIRRSHFTHVHEKLGFGIILFNFFQLCFFGLLIMLFFLFIFKLTDISRLFITLFFIIYLITISLLQVYRSQCYRYIKKIGSAQN
jgi:hypothetical protein